MKVSGYRTVFDTWVVPRTLADDLREDPPPVDPTPHVHFHAHGGVRHSHEHVHPEPHAHSARSDEPKHAEAVA